MKMRSFSTATTFCAAMLLMSGSAQAGPISLLDPSVPVPDGDPNGTRLTTQLAASGVIFENTGVGGLIGSFPDNTFGTEAMGPEQGPGEANRRFFMIGGLGNGTVMRFVDPLGDPAFTDFISFRVGDGDAESEGVEITVRGLAGVILHQETIVTSGGLTDGGKDFSFSASEIESVSLFGTFTGRGSGAVTTAQSIGNLRTINPPVLSAPATALLLGLGVVGMNLRRSGFRPLTS